MKNYWAGDGRFKPNDVYEKCFLWLKEDVKCLWTKTNGNMYLMDELFLWLCLILSERFFSYWKMCITDD